MNIICEISVILRRMKNYNDVGCEKSYSCFKHNATSHGLYDDMCDITDNVLDIFYNIKNDITCFEEVDVKIDHYDISRVKEFGCAKLLLDVRLKQKEHNMDKFRGAVICFTLDTNKVHKTKESKYNKLYIELLNFIYDYSFTNFCFPGQPLPYKQYLINIMAAANSYHDVLAKNKKK